MWREWIGYIRGGKVYWKDWGVYGLVILDCNWDNMLFIFLYLELNYERDGVFGDGCVKL